MSPNILTFQWTHSWHFCMDVALTNVTALLAYFYIIWRIWIHRCLDGDEDKFRLNWPSMISMPEVVTIQDKWNKKQQ